MTVLNSYSEFSGDRLPAKTLVRYINFEDMGMVLGYGCGTPGMTNRSAYPQEAYELGRSL